MAQVAKNVRAWMRRHSGNGMKFSPPANRITPKKGKWERAWKIFDDFIFINQLNFFKYLIKNLMIQKEGIILKLTDTQINNLKK
jgi:hypothetical protein